MACMCRYADLLLTRCRLSGPCRPGVLPWVDALSAPFLWLQTLFKRCAGVPLHPPSNSRAVLFFLPSAGCVQPRAWKPGCASSTCVFPLGSFTLAACRVEVLCHDISVHVPHHVSSKIPWYNLRMANESLRKNWGQVSCCHMCPLAEPGSAAALQL